MANRTDAKFSTDAKREAVLEATPDMRPTTLIEQSLMGGDRVNMPVGNPTTPRPEIQTTGGRGTGDALDARNLGSNGRKW